MAITEKSRNELRTYLEETMGEERATTLMEHLPPVGWADVATRQDLDQLRAATRQDLALVRGDVEQVRADTSRDIAHLREIMDTRFDSMATKAQLADLRSEFHSAFRSQTLTLMATNLTLFGLVLAAVKIH